MNIVGPDSSGTGRANWIGLWTLYRREVRRFLAVAAQTVLGPVVTTLLFLAVFAVVMAGRGQSQTVGGVPYLAFLAPGLIVMAMAQNAFANSSSSLLIAKVQGNIADLLMAPLSPAEFVAGIALGAVTRGLLVGGVVAVAMRPFVPLGFAHPAFVAFHALAGRHPSIDARDPTALRAEVRAAPSAVQRCPARRSPGEVETSSAAA